MLVLAVCGGICGFEIRTSEVGKVVSDMSGRCLGEG